MQYIEEIQGSFFVVEIQLRRKYWVVVSRDRLENPVDYFNRNYNGPYNYITELVPLHGTYSAFETFEAASKEARRRNRPRIKQYRAADILIRRSIEYTNIIKRLPNMQSKLEKSKKRIEERICKKLEGLEAMLPIRNHRGLEEFDLLLRHDDQPTSLACKILFDTLTDKENLKESLYNILNAFFTAESKKYCIKDEKDDKRPLKNLKILDRIKNYLARYDQEFKSQDLMNKWFLDEAQ